VGGARAQLPQLSPRSSSAFELTARPGGGQAMDGGGAERTAAGLLGALPKLPLDSLAAGAAGALLSPGRASSTASPRRDSLRPSISRAYTNQGPRNPIFL
jgi:hypothetical protein